MDEESTATGGARPERTDRVMQIVIGALVLAVLVLGGYFGYNVWVTGQSERLATPALRLIESLKEDIRNNPNNAELRVRLGEALGAAGLYSEAIEQLETALELSPEHSGAFLDLGLISMELEEYAAAESYFLRVVELTEGTDFTNISDRRELALFYLGEVSLIQERYEDAIGYFKGALRIRRDASDTYYSLGVAYKGIGEYDAALAEFEVALAFDPNYPQAHYEMGLIYFDQGDYVNAALRLRDAADIAPDVELVQEALSSLGFIEDWIAEAESKLSDDDIEGALNDILVARALEPTNVEAILIHGQILETMGNDDAAAEEYRAGLEENPDDEDLTEALERVDGE